MNGSTRRRICSSFFFVFLIIITLVSADGEGKDGVAKEEKPSLVKIICGIFGKKFPPSSWELVKVAVKKIQMKLYSPNLDLRSNSDKIINKKDGEDKNGGGGEISTTGEKVKEAATKSISVSKEAIEESAKVAGNVVNEVVQKTAEKITTTHDEM